MRNVTPQRFFLQGPLSRRERQGPENEIIVPPMHQCSLEKKKAQLISPAAFHFFGQGPLSRRKDKVQENNQTLLSATILSFLTGTAFTEERQGPKKYIL